MFTNVFEEHAVSILCVENQIDCGKCGIDMRRRVAEVIALTEPDRNMKNFL
jgi:hypothetical protein